MGTAASVCVCIGDDDDESGTKKSSGWCVDDDAEEAVFIPEDGRTKYIVTGLGGATIRAGERLESPVIRTLPQGTIVDIDIVRSRRARITQPLRGWGSVSTKNGYVIMERLVRPTKYKVVYKEGAFVRSAADIDNSQIIKVVQCGAILKSTGKVEVFDGIERVQVEGGWVSMRLREDRGRGARVLKPLELG